MKRHRVHRPANPPPSQPPDRSWASRAAALRQEKPANFAMIGAVFATVTAFAGWTAVLAAPHGDVRGRPLFWLLAIPLLCWTTPILRFRAWAVNLVWLTLLLAPLLSLAALLTAWQAGGAHPPALDPARLDTPGAMLTVLGITMALSIGGAAALRRSSLPGGTQKASYMAPGTLPPEQQPWLRRPDQASNDPAAAARSPAPSRSSRVIAANAIPPTPSRPRRTWTHIRSSLGIPRVRN